ncbi:hypothetical protein DOTSEDRAFT_86436 [Dothistroma septosporum NZE10]|uniref:Uncharacterized protein n=1 Tax=Dothistroma septosporum (strain NZE10 / CBS 128990) TaxID=675120 RepID=N1PXG4_DOTSN|nr:hypothetical protein DOTSEDRAFT_86436 [Dothistroma septosporum NZE10]
MVYLTYDNLHLPDTIIFTHAKRYQWHRCVNVRSVGTLGCPAEIRPLLEAEAPAPASGPHSEEARAATFYKEAFEEPFSNFTVPEQIGPSCCAQSAATVDEIRERPKIIFGGDAVHCPNVSECYCNLFGLCRLHCESEGTCRAAYTLPKYLVLPESWPELNWYDKRRNATQERQQFEEENMRGRRRPALSHQDVTVN